MKKIVVLGGGYAGVLTAKKLAKKFKKNKDVQITLIDKQSYHTMLTELHEVAAGRVDEESIRMDLKRIFAGRNVEVVLDEIKTIDFDQKVLVSDQQSYEYDYLVIGTGCKPTFFGIPGAEHAHQLWSYTDAVNLREHILNMFRQAALTADKQKRRELLTFVTVGAGFTGVEMAGELGEWKDELCRSFHIDRDEVSLYIVDFAPKVLPMYPDKLIKKAEKRLIKLGNELVMNSAVSEIHEDKVVLNKGEKVIQTHTVIWAAGIEGSDIVDQASVEKAGRGRIVTNGHLQAKDYEDVYVVGDNIFYIPEGEERPVPQMVENAEHSAPVVAHNIAVDINGGTHKTYKPTFHGSMVCIGSRYGVAQVGMPGMWFNLSGFFAMASKHLINIIYFIQVLGFNKIWSYLMHEFFHTKNNRSMVGGLLSNSAPVFWKFPLRIFIGFMWLQQGLTKLPKIVHDFNNVFLLPAPPKADTIGGASEAVSQVVPEVVETVTAASGAIAEGASSAAAAVSQTVSDVVSNSGDIFTMLADAIHDFMNWITVLPVPGFVENMVNWSMDAFFYTPDGTQFTQLASLVQGGMICGEIIFGGMLIIGLFTPVAAIATIAMGCMIWASGMAPTEMLWYLVGGFALIGNSGMVLGLDYYVWPWIRKMLPKIPLLKKWYLYVD
ncbi:MAG: NAD(P)/FAD-dependent oxidoreductase [Turicibacter sp.]|jgi:NADH dehydrogenase|uniref:NADH:ubiquinone reductase (non-electrogenic) n=1 Tax=Turicibacter faecis TaxID=2963365 RepID=A0ABM8IPF1_9FIRM|nr:MULTISPECIES: NAD(P)/FAD-dependent oxidoreductase [unclassified Turicibacter]MCI9350579.1 NAD(P)/FAD-dependent oxidoreductase [Turicibacter sp.]BEH91478.1 NADH dehydrogenase [Turicibacter sp. TC023]MCU7204880.1 NAD(P)/FAD-dependent oxidoreductase [Turicibacter sp. TA25]MCU7208427.1 NAD(P)/FAD-dependent oxidoreductase [Turicibacter sp. 1E2]NCE78078.1 NAD(P)/FAD-dependent oxidoreductase [Turicibacter sp. TS3]